MKGKFIEVRSLTPEERAIIGRSGPQNFYCEQCHEDIGNGLRVNDLPHHDYCGQHHAADVACEDELDIHQFDEK